MKQQTSERARPRARSRVRRAALVGVVAVAAALGWFLRDCVGVGPGGPGRESGRAERDAGAVATDAGPRPATDAGRGSCQLFLDRDGLTLDGRPAVAIDEAVRACRVSGTARLRATGDARAGTFDELVRALDQAGVTVERY